MYNLNANKKSILIQTEKKNFVKKKWKKFINFKENLKCLHV